MNTSGEAAEQVMRMSLEGAEILIKLTGSGAKNVAVLLYSIYKEQNKTRGKERLTNMLRSGKPLKVYIETHIFANRLLKRFYGCVARLRQVAISSIIHIYDRQMPICLKAPDFQGLFRISGVKNTTIRRSKSTICKKN